MLRLSSKIWRGCYTALLLAPPIIIVLYAELIRRTNLVMPDSPARYLTPLLVWAIITAIALFKPNFCARWFQAGERLIARLARQRKLAVALVGLVAFVVSATISLAVYMPRPVITDEFCHLLAADTFAHGHLSYPTHPMWVHFETVGVIHQPSYASKYPPGQGLILALGQVLTGHPIVGAWLGIAFACAALCWMLLGWLPPRWALLGSLVAILHPTILQWSQNYWGGAVAMGGGALLLGAFRRLLQQPRARDAYLMGVGLAALANSRAYEGLVLSLLVLLPLCIKLLGQNGPPVAVSLKRIVIPLVIVLAPTVGAMCFYNLRITGHALRLPYKVHQAEYDIAPSFIWQTAQPEPVYRHSRLREVHVDWELPFHTLHHSSVSGFVAAMMEKIVTLAYGAFPLLTLAMPLLALPMAMSHNFWVRFSLLIGAIFLIAALLDTWMWPHYAAPAVGLAFVVVLQAMRYLHAWRWHGRSCGRFIVRASVLLFVASLAQTCLSFYTYYSYGWGGWIENREKIIARLQQEPGQQLVIVRYGRNHSIHHEWIFNEADIDQAKIVWAREMGAEQNSKLLEYFKDRRVWLLKAETQTPALIPYTSESTSPIEPPLTQNASR